MDSEEWRLIQDFPMYLVSSLGRIQNVNTKQIRSARPNHQNFPTLVLYKADNATRYVRQVNKLVAEAFLDQPDHHSKTSVWHMNGDLDDCRARNLKWDTRARVMEWNDMWRTATPRLRTPRVMVNATGRIFNNAFECGLFVGQIESAIVTHIESFPAHYADRGRYKYVTD